MGLNQICARNTSVLSRPYSLLALVAELMWIFPIGSFLLLPCWGQRTQKSLPGIHGKVSHGIGGAVLENYKTTFEKYMEQHQFLEADKKKVWDFLKRSHATEAYMTRNDLHYKDKFGIPGVISRSLLGIQDNFI